MSITATVEDGKILLPFLPFLMISALPHAVQQGAASATKVDLRPMPDHRPIR